MLYRWLIRPLLYALPAETAHRLTMSVLSVLSRVPALPTLVQRVCRVRDPRLVVEAFGLQFPNPLGLAAGLDKDAEAYPMLGALGFGFIEVGTLTAQAQPGNPRPRLFRLVRDRALVNRMGFNNHGAAAAAGRLGRRPAGEVRLGINIGKTKSVANEAALDDYAQSARQLASYADYVVINVSSPNTPGLRDLQAVSALRPLIESVRHTLDTTRPEPRVPLVLKIAPDLSDDDVDAIADLALELGLDGIIASNTTVARAGLTSDPRVVAACGAGGLSGPVLKARALAIVRRLHARVGERVVLIAVGGIESADDVWDFLCAGAKLVQLYTALIYQGPGLPRRITRDLSQRLASSGVSSLQAVRRDQGVRRTT